MAVYNVEAVNEALNNNEESSIIDSLEEACDYMLGVLESGGAYRKYMNMQADKQDKLNKEADKYQKIANNATSDKVREKAQSKAYKYSGMADSIYQKEYDQDHLSSSGRSGNGKSIRDHLENDDDNGKYDAGDAKANWKYHHGDRGEDKFAKREPGTFKTSEGLSKNHEARDQKKKTIKETCLHILSILDDIE